MEGRRELEIGTAKGHLWRNQIDPWLKRKVPGSRHLVSLSARESSRLLDGLNADLIRIMDPGPPAMWDAKRNKTAPVYTVITCVSAHMAGIHADYYITYVGPRIMHRGRHPIALLPDRQIEFIIAPRVFAIRIIRFVQRSLLRTTHF